MDKETYRKTPPEDRPAEELIERIEEPVSQIGNNVAKDLSKASSQIGEAISHKIGEVADQIFGDEGELPPAPNNRNDELRL